MAHNCMLASSVFKPIPISQEVSKTHSEVQMILFNLCVQVGYNEWNKY